MLMFVSVGRARRRELPRSLAGSGEINVSTSVDGKRSNVVRVNVK